jgi:competence protein ComEC
MSVDAAPRRLGASRVLDRADDDRGFARPPGGGWRLRLDETARRLIDGAEDDLARGAAPPLLAACFAGGIALWFTLPAEPSGFALALLFVVVAGSAAFARRRGGRAIGRVILAAVLAGGLVAAFGSWRAAAPRLDHDRTVAVTGRVVDLDATAKGGTRLTVDVGGMEGGGLTPATTPARVTATLARGRTPPAMGDAIAFKARLKPPDGPVLPGGYDFARRAWFEGRGAGGYVLGGAHPGETTEPSRLDRLLAPIGDLRHRVADRVRAGLPGGTGTIAAAIMVGEQRAIPESVGEPLRASGLTHIVSISGLHMSLVAGGVMIVIRMLMALSPRLALEHPTKKWAAVAAFVAATFYLLMSGMQVAALRSHIMVSIALLAVIVDRPAITMHTVAVAAVGILLFDPESAMEPSFQMSFLAVIALVASWDLWQLHVAARPPRPEARGPIVHAVVAAWHHAEGLAFSSLIAGLATAPVIAGIFYRGAPYSILANMVVLPVVGMAVMPAAVVAFLAMPFGLEGLPLWVMGLGIDWMVAVGRWTSALPGGGGLLGAPHWAAMPLGVAAVLWLSLWRSRLRLFGLVPGVLSIVLLGCGPRPDVMIGRHGSPVAVRGDDGRLHVLATRDDAFDTAIWLAADADPRDPRSPGIADGWRCDAIGCAFVRGGDGTAVAAGDASGEERAQAAAPGEGAGGTDGPDMPAHPPADGRVSRHAMAAVPADRRPEVGGRPALRVVVVRHPRGFVEDCGRADVVISALAAPPGCAATSLVLDRVARARTGAVTIDVAATSRSAATGQNGTGVDEPSVSDRGVSRPGGSDGAVDPTRDDAVPDDAKPRTGDAAPDVHKAAVAARDARPSAAPSPAPSVVDPTPTATRLVFTVTPSLPASPRAWTPRDPNAVRALAEVTADPPDGGAPATIDPDPSDLPERAPAAPE